MKILKNIICVVFISIIGGKVSAQNVADIYFICKTTSNENVKKGIWRGILPANSLDKHNPIGFLMRSKSKGYNIWFSHYNFNLTEVAKIRPLRDNEYQMEIVIKPNSFYSNTIKRATHFNLNDKLNSFKSAKEAWDWAKTLKGKRIYIYDQTDLMNRGEEGDGTTLRLVEVRLDGTNEPDGELVIE